MWDDLKQCIADRLTPILVNKIGIKDSCNQCICSLIRKCKDRKFGNHQINIEQLLHKCWGCNKFWEQIDE